MVILMICIIKCLLEQRWKLKKEDIKIDYGFCFGYKIYDIVASYDAKTF